MYPDEDAYRRMEMAYREFGANILRPRIVQDAL
jgi:hypothetical protein